MPSLSDLANAFAAITAFQQIFGLVLVVAIVVLLPDWRVSLAALAVQYLLVAVLLSTLIPLQIAAVRLIAGGLVATMFYLTARRTQPGRKRRRNQADSERIEIYDESTPRGIYWANFPFRFIALALVALSVVVVSGQFVLLNAPLLFWATG